jgi:hypothetical protein
MKTARKNGTKKRRGRPATGQGAQIGMRWAEETIAAIDAWAAKQDDKPGRSDAIRRLVEIGLTVKARPKQAGPGRARKADEMAGRQLDQLVDKSAPTEEQESRKQRLLKGPEEFRNVRVDRAKAKAK